jgi:hypothetical protein
MMKTFTEANEVNGEVNGVQKKSVTVKTRRLVHAYQPGMFPPGKIFRFSKTSRGIYEVQANGATIRRIGD